MSALAYKKTGMPRRQLCCVPTAAILANGDRKIAARALLMLSCCPYVGVHCTHLRQMRSLFVSVDVVLD